MPISVKIASEANNSTLLSTPGRAKSVSLVPKETGETKSITVTITGVSNRIIHAYRKIFWEFLVEESRGHIFSELRLTKKIEAARLLYPEARRELRGLTVTLK